jgi:hypothetical protein
LVSSGGALLPISSLAFAANYAIAFFPVAVRPIRICLLSCRRSTSCWQPIQNLIPIPPLDGSKILAGFTSERFQAMMARFEPFGFILIIVLLYLRVLDPVISFLRWLILAVISLILP